MKNKKMKNLKNIAVTAMIALGMSSCSGFLDSEPITKLVDANYYRTEADADAALTGCYDGLQMMVGGEDGINDVFLASLVMSDECFGGAGTADGNNNQMIDRFDQGISPNDISMFNNLWIRAYKALYRCNMLLSKMDQIEWNSETKRNTIEAETRFIRAYIYFDMVRFWGPVPLVTKPLDVKEANLPRTDVNEIYKVIEQDLLFACEHAQLAGGQSWSTAWAQTSGGHATIYAAKALLARTFLFYTGYYGESTLPNGTTKEAVTTQLKDLLTSGHDLILDYKRLWPAASSTIDASTELGLATTYIGDANQEIVFGVKFNSTSTWDGSQDGFRVLVNLAMRSGSYNYSGLPYAASGWGIGTVNPEFAKSFNEDPRYTPSIIDCVAEGITPTGSTTQREYTGYYNKKYTFLGTGPGTDIYALQSLNFQINPYQQFNSIRYSDVLLMLSELTDDAQYMNAVRERVGLAPVAYSVETLRNERKMELAFEGVRYWDLLRYDSSLDYAANAICGEFTVENGIDETLVISTEKFKRCKGLSQIPQEQIDLSNGVLTQNQGWGTNR